MSRISKRWLHTSDRLSCQPVSGREIANVVLLRHAESVSNAEGRFAGWTDVRLTEAGVVQAREAAAAMVAADVTFDVCYTSLLFRAIRTLWIVLEESDRAWLPVVKTWRLNERHYGALQGHSKIDTARDKGESQVHQWHRGFHVRPPALDLDDPRHPRFDRRYSALRPEHVPNAESLADTVARVVPFWEEVVLPELRSGQNALVVAHGGSLRALIRHVCGVSEDEVKELAIPTGKPFLLELDGHMHLSGQRWL